MTLLNDSKSVDDAMRSSVVGQELCPGKGQKHESL